MSVPRLRLLAVDLDGTLVDSAPDLAHCVDEAMLGAGVAPPGEALTRTWIGDGIETLLRKAFEHRGAAAGTREFDAALAAFSACYRENLFVRSRLYDGVRETLAELEARGVALACVTNKRLEFAEALLTAAGIRGRFASVIGGDSLPEKKPSPMPLAAAARESGVTAAQAAMVGDSHHDHDAAAAAGFAFVWASYGYCSRIDARPDAPFATIRAFAELGALI